MAEVLTGVNGQILRWAREGYNMSTSETAMALGIDEQRYINGKAEKSFRPMLN